MLAMLDPAKNAEFIRLWALHGQRIYAYLLTLASNRSDAEEIYQEVAMTLWEKFDQFEEGTSFYAWARKVAFNKVGSFRQLRRHETILCTPEFLDSMNETVAEDSELLDAQHRAFARCFEKLPPRHRELIEERYRPGATPKTVAQQMGRSVSAIYQALSRIHNSLFECVRKATLEKGTS
jgi:RNA polymerase sigma-70 factor (ECF subfamily)